MYTTLRRLPALTAYCRLRWVEICHDQFLIYPTFLDVWTYEKLRGPYEEDLDLAKAKCKGCWGRSSRICESGSRSDNAPNHHVPAHRYTYFSIRLHHTISKKATDGWLRTFSPVSERLSFIVHLLMCYSKSKAEQCHRLTCSLTSKRTLNSSERGLSMADT